MSFFDVLLAKQLAGGGGGGGGGDAPIITVRMTNKQSSNDVVNMPIYGLPVADQRGFMIKTFRIGSSTNVLLLATYNGKAVLQSSLFEDIDVYIDESSTGIERITDDNEYYGAYAVSDGANIVFYASY